MPWGLRPAVSARAARVLPGLAAWLGTELIAGSGQVGLAERALGVAQAVWPLAVVLSCRLSQVSASTPRRRERPALGYLPRRGLCCH